jgi:hypothetical protein
MPRKPNKSERWQVFFTDDVSRALASKPEFHALLAFARAMNVVRFTLENLTRPFDGKIPAHRRRLASSAFLAGGLLNEIRISGNRLGEWYRELPEYSALADVWKGDPLGSPPLNSLIKLRDTGVAHFDPGPFRTVLEKEEVIEGFRWAEGRGPHMGEFYYELADDLLVTFLLSGPDSKEATEAQIEEFWTAFSGLLIRLHATGARLISAITRRLGADVRRV